MEIEKEMEIEMEIRDETGTVERISRVKYCATYDVLDSLTKSLETLYCDHSGKKEHFIASCYCSMKPVRCD